MTKYLSIFPLQAHAPHDLLNVARSSLMGCPRCFVLRVDDGWLVPEEILGFCDGMQYLDGNSGSPGLPRQLPQFATLRRKQFLQSSSLSLLVNQWVQIYIINIEIKSVLAKVGQNATNFLPLQS